LSGCVRLVFEKLAFCLLVLFIFYFICVYVGLKVELLDRLVGWFDRNFGLDRVHGLFSGFLVCCLEGCEALRTHEGRLSSVSCMFMVLRGRERVEEPVVVAISEKVKAAREWYEKGFKFEAL